MKSTRLFFGVRAIFLLIACSLAYSAPNSVVALEYVGRAVCVTCHQEQFQRWQNSHHDLAMQEATPETVLGNFDNIEFTNFNITSTFTKKDKKFFVETDGPVGELENYEIKYVFGVYPLQQYLVEFAGGRYQSLGIAWDSRPQKEGGQRWFHLYPDRKITHDDRLHWTGADQNWNYMCAECHSTNLIKNFNQENNHYQTTWSELNVSCEACHGPGAEHVTWAQQKEGQQTRKDKGLQVLIKESAMWIIDSETGLASRSTPRNSHLEIETCARCHSRRSQQWDDYKHGQALLDSHRPATLSDPLYYPDGQINEEVYVYGSFLQSKMYQKGVTCSDCHDPHSLQLKAEGNQLCGTCHLAAKFNSPKHHFHEAGNEGASCTSCHMPEKNFMVIDARADHSLRIPRPDLSLTLGSPNACTQCHQDQSDTWAAKAIERWYPASPRRKELHYGEALYAGRIGSIGANQLLIDLANDTSQPAIVRATSTSLLQDYIDANTLPAVNELLHDDAALVRFSAIRTVEPLPSDVKVKLLRHLLTDNLRMIRIEAARALAGSQAQISDVTVRTQFEQAIKEYIEAQNVNAERPESHTNLGSLYTSMGRVDQAQAEYEQAISIDSEFIPAYINLADLYRARNLDNEGKRYLQIAIEKRPDTGSAYYALGLLYVRQKNIDDALSLFRQAVEIEPQNILYKYIYAVALDSTGKYEESIKVLTQAHEQRPSYRDVLYALISFHQKAGNHAKAKQYNEVLRKISTSTQRH